VEEKIFIKDIIKNITIIDTFFLTNVESLEKAINSFSKAIESTWEKNSKIINISRHSKSWWNINCSRDLEKYRSTRSLVDWKQFKKTVKSTKCLVFDQKIQEILNKARELWELINWVKKRNLPAVEAIKYNNCPFLEINNFWHALHSTFNLAQNYQVDVDILEEIPDKSSEEWPPFSKEEFMKAINKCNNLSTPEPDRLS